MKILKGIKRILFTHKSVIFFILFFTIFVWFGLNAVYAQDSLATSFVTDFRDILETLLRVIYMLLWPVLFLAWIAVDNSLIYWEVFGLDQPLWQIWNIMKNFANFALWFIMLYYILKNIFTPQGENNIFDTIKKIVIATVAIQASWFLSAAIIDISTILTYSVWAMPMNVSMETQDNSVNLQNKPMFKIHPVMNMWDNTGNDGKNKISESFYYYYSGWGKYISPCKTKVLEVNEKQESLIIGREYVTDILDWTSIYFEKSMCIYNWWPFRYEEPENLQWLTNNLTYNEQLEIETKTKLDDGIESCAFVNPNNISDKCKDSWVWPIKLQYDEEKKTYSGDSLFEDTTDWISMDSIVDEGWDFVWAFVSLYSSLINFTELSSTSNVDINTSAWWSLFLFFIKALFAVLLFAPLVALVIVLLIRVWILWMVIAAIPLLIIKRVFFKDSKWMWFIDEYLSIQEITKLIFAPVFFVFAVSLSMIFVGLVTENPNGTNWMNSDNYSNVSTWQNNMTILWWLVDLSYFWPEVEQWKDLFSWLISSIMSVWIVWFILFAAIKFSKIWEFVWGKIESIATQAAKNVPILPVPGGSINAINQVANSQIHKMSAETTKQTSALEEALGIRKANPSELDVSKYNAYRTVDYSSAASNWNQVKNTTVAWAVTSAVAAWWWTADWNNLYNNNVSDLQNTDINNANDLASAYYSANRDQIVDFEQLTSDTANISDMELNIFMNLNGTWKDRAKTNLWKNVKTKNWEFVLDNLWTSNTPNYKLLKRSQYEEKYFGWSVAKWTTNEFIDRKVKSMKAELEEAKDDNDKAIINWQIDSVNSNKSEARAYLEERIKEMEESRTPWWNNNEPQNNNDQDDPIAENPQDPQASEEISEWGTAEWDWNDTTWTT